MLWPSTGKGKIHLGGYNLLKESWKPVIKATGNGEQAVAPLKSLKQIPVSGNCRNRSSALQIKWEVYVVKFTGLYFLHRTMYVEQNVGIWWGKRLLRDSQTCLSCTTTCVLHCQILSGILLRSYAMLHETALSLCNISMAKVKLNPMDRMENESLSPGKQSVKGKKKFYWLCSAFSDKRKGELRRSVSSARLSV